MVGNATKMGAWSLSLFQDRSKLVIRCCLLDSLEYCCPLWSPSDVASIQAIESVQQHFTKKISGYQHLSYYNQLKGLHLQSLQCRQERYILIHMWKIKQSLCLNDLEISFSENNTRLSSMADLLSLVRSSRAVHQTLYDNSFTVVLGPKL